MKTKLILVFTAIVIALSACSKKGEPTPTPIIPAELKTYLSKQITANTTTTWTYDAQNKVASMVFVSPNETSSYNLKINSLNAEGAIVEAVIDFVSASAADIKRTNVYNAEGKLTRQTNSNLATGAIGNYITLEYLAGNQTKVTYYNANDVVTSSRLYTKSADGKNLIDYKFYRANGTLSSTAVLSNFDTKKSYDYLDIKGFYLGVTSENNYQTETVTEAGVSAPTTTSYTYEYNADGYVTKMYAGNALIFTFEYIKK